jgi:hypothetical protein
MNPANVFILLWKLSQPGTSIYIISSFWINPNVINIMILAKGDWMNPLQNIKPSFSFPHGNILITDTCLERITEIETAVTALYAVESFRGHVAPLFIDIFSCHTL